MKDWQKVVVPKHVEKKAEDRVLIAVSVESANGKIIAGQHVPCTIRRDSNDPNAKFVRTPVVRTDAGRYVSGGDFVHDPFRMIVYRSELDAIRASMRQPEHVEELYSCRRQYEERVREMTRKMKKDEEREQFVASDGVSVESMLADRGFRMGIPTLVGLDVLDDAVPPPDIPAARQAKSDGQIADTLDAIRALLERLTPQAQPSQQRDERGDRNRRG